MTARLPQDRRVGHFCFDECMYPSQASQEPNFELTCVIVERRRRNAINEGINKLAKIVPGCGKNKGSIIQRAVAFIAQLKENEQQNIEKWTLQKLLAEQAITELSSSNDKLKQECDRLYRELEIWKKAAQGAGLQPSVEGWAHTKVPTQLKAEPNTPCFTR
jgi:hypothetical protein